MTRNLPFTTRVGAVDYAWPYARAGVEQIYPGVYKLSIINDHEKHYSAGLMGPDIEEGTYTFIVHGQLGAIDPWTVFSIWFHNEDGTELDVVETYEGDPNFPERLRMTSFTKGASIVDRLPYSARRFSRFRFTLVVANGTFQILAEGDRKGTWVTLTDWWGGPLLDFRQLRIGLYVRKGGLNPTGQHWYGTKDDVGPTSVVLESATFTAP